MRKLFLKSLFAFGIALSTSYGMENKEKMSSNIISISNSKKHNVPYIPQNDNYSCASTSMAMAISYFENLSEPLDKEFVWKISGSDKNDVLKFGNDIDGLKRIADHYGYKGELLENMNISDIEKLISQKALVIPLITVDKKTSATHSFLVIGYDRENEMLYINDPSGKVDKINYSDFEAQWESAFLSSPRKKANKSAYVIYPKN